MYYFKIHALESGKVLDASMSNEGEVVLWEANGQMNQLWFWDGPDRDVLRNKAFPHLVKATTKASNYHYLKPVF